MRQVSIAARPLNPSLRPLTMVVCSLCDQLVHIPMQDNLDSLNAAVAGSLLLYEVLRPASG